MLKLYVQEYLNTINKTQYWLSKKTGISANAISKICNGETIRITLDALSKICEALNCTPNDIIKPANSPFKWPESIIDSDKKNDYSYQVELDGENCVRISKQQFENLLKSMLDKAFDKALEEINSGTE